MYRLIVPVSALLLSVSLLLMGNGLQNTLLPLRASLESFSPLSIGVLGSAYFFGFAIGCLSGPLLIRRVGHIRTFTAMATIASCTALAHVIFLEPVVWWILRIVTGICFAVLYMIIESWLNERATNENRGTLFSIYTIINLTVITIGQMMLTLDDPKNFMLFSLASVLVSLSAVPVALSSSPEPAPIKSVKVRVGKLLRLSPVGAVGCFTVGLTNGSFWSLAPVFAQGDHSDTNTIAIFMSVAVIAGAIGQFPLGRISDKMDRRCVILVACFGAAIAGVALSLFELSTPTLLLAAVFGYGLFGFPLYALSVAHTNDYASKADFVEVACGLLLVYAVGAVIGPIVASVCMRYSGPGGLFAFTAVMHIAMGIFAIYRLNCRDTTPTEEHIPFADALLIAQTVSAIDPTTSSVQKEDD
ncbi:MAG: MFS family permease [Gammaproteobacteria bacterium]|jgi:MFS family permease